MSLLYNHTNSLFNSPFVEQVPKESSTTETNHKIYELSKQVRDGSIQEAEILVDWDFKNRNFCHLREITKESDAKGRAIWIQFKSAEFFKGMTQVTLRDTKSKDLEKCNYIFSQMEFKDTVGMLERFCSPHFGGKQAIELIKGLMPILHLKSLVLQDGSMVLPNRCCVSGAITSLSILEILKYNRTWYQSLGAQLLDFDDLSQYEIVFRPKVSENFSMKFPERPTTELPEEFARVKKECLDSESKKGKVNNDLFLSASNYFHQLKLEDLISLFKEYPADHAFFALFELLINIQRLADIPSSSSLGEVAKILIQKGKDSGSIFHHLKHQFLEKIVNQDVPHFLVFATETLETTQDLLLRNLLLGLLIPQVQTYEEYIFQKQIPEEDINSLDPSKNMAALFMNIFFAEDDSELEKVGSFFNHSNFYAKGRDAIRQYLREEMESETNPIATKLFSNNYEKSQVDYIDHSFLGIDRVNPIYLVYSMSKVLKDAKISDIETHFHDFSEKINEKCGAIILASNSSLTLKEFLFPLKEHPELALKFFKSFLAFFTEQKGDVFRLNDFFKGDKEKNKLANYFLAKFSLTCLFPKMEFKA